MSDIKKIKILNLVGDLNTGLMTYFDIERFHIIERGAIDAFNTIDYIFVSNITQAQNTYKEFGCEKNEIKLIAIGEIKEVREFMLSNGRLMIAPYFTKLDLGKAILNRFFFKDFDIHLSASFEQTFSNTKEFAITNHINMGNSIDKLSFDAFANDFNLVPIRSFIDHTVYYLTYLKQSGLAGIPFEVEYGNTPDFFAINIQTTVKNFVAEYILDSFGEVNAKDPLSYLVGVMNRSCDYFDVASLEEPNKLVVSGIWCKNADIPLKGIGFNNILTTSQVVAQVEKQLENYNPEQVNDNSEVQDKKLPGGINELKTKLEINSVLNLKPEKAQQVVEFASDSFAQEFPNESLTNISMDELEEIIQKHPDQELMSQLSENDKEHLVERLQKKEMIEAFEEEIIRAKEKLEEDPEFENQVQDAVSDEISNQLIGSIDEGVFDNLFEESPEDQIEDIQFDGDFPIADLEDFNVTAQEPQEVDLESTEINTSDFAASAEDFNAPMMDMSLPDIDIGDPFATGEFNPNMPGNEEEVQVNSQEQQKSEEVLDDPFQTQPAQFAEPAPQNIIPPEFENKELVKTEETHAITQIDPETGNPTQVELPVKEDPKTGQKVVEQMQTVVTKDAQTGEEKPVQIPVQMDIETGDITPIIPEDPTVQLAIPPEELANINLNDPLNESESYNPNNVELPEGVKAVKNPVTGEPMFLMDDPNTGLPVAVEINEQTGVATPIAPAAPIAQPAAPIQPQLPPLPEGVQAFVDPNTQQPMFVQMDPNTGLPTPVEVNFDTGEVKPIPSVPESSQNVEGGESESGEENTKVSGGETPAEPAVNPITGQPMMKMTDPNTGSEIHISMDPHTGQPVQVNPVTGEPVQVSINQTVNHAQGETNINMPEMQPIPETVVGGLPEEEEVSQTIGGGEEEEDVSQVVGGGEDEDEFMQVVEGGLPDDMDPDQFVKDMGLEDDPEPILMFGGDDEDEDISLVRGGQDEADDFMDSISGYDDDDDSGLFDSFGSGLLDESGGFDFSSSGGVEKKDFANMVSRSLGQDKDMNQGVKGFIKKNAPEELEKGFKEFAKKNGVAPNELSKEQVQHFAQKEAPQIVKSLIKDENKVKDFEKQLVSAPEKKPSDFLNDKRMLQAHMEQLPDSAFNKKKEEIEDKKDSQLFEAEFKKKLQDKMQQMKSKMLDLQKEAGAARAELNKIKNEKPAKEDVQNVLHETVKESFKEALGDKNLSPEEREKKEKQVVKGLSKTLQVPEEQVKDIVKQMDQKTQEIEKEIVQDKMQKNQEEGSESSNMSQAALMKKLKKIESENKNLKENMNAMKLKTEASRDVKEKVDKVNEESKKIDDKKLDETKLDEKNQIEVKAQEVKLEDEEKNALLEKMKNGEKLTDEERLKVSTVFDSSENVIKQIQREAEKSIKRLQIEAENKDALFKAELDRSAKSLKAKELVLEKAKETMKEQIARKEKEVQETKEQMTEMAKRMEDDKSSNFEHQVKALSKEKENLEKLNETYKTKIDALAKAAQDSNSDEISNVLSDENRTLKRVKAGLEKKAQDIEKQKNNLEQNYQKLQDSEMKAKSELALLKTEQKQNQGLMKTLKDQQEAMTLKVKKLTTTKTEAAEKELDIQKEQNAKLNAKLKEMQLKVSKQDVDVNRIDEKKIEKVVARKYENQLAMSKKEVEVAKNQSKQLQAKIKELTDKLKGGGSTGDAAAGGGNSKEKQLAQSVKKMNAELTKAKGEVNAQKKEVMKAKKEVTMVKNQMLNLKKELEKAKKMAGKKAA